MVGRITWLAAAMLAGAWTLLCLAADGLLGWIGEIGLANADLFTGHPETVSVIAWLIEALGSLGTALVVVAWAIGAALILGSAALLSRVLAPGRHGQVTGVRQC